MYSSKDLYKALDKYELSSTKRDMERRLHEAALMGSVASLNELLQEDALILDRVIVACVTDTPLHIAAILGHVDFVREILNRKPEFACEINLRRSSPLHLASAKGYIEIVKDLLSINSDMCLAHDRDGRTPLHLAAMKGRVMVLKELVHANPEATRVIAYQRKTILHLCVKYNQFEALRMLVDTISDDDFVNREDDNGNNILHLAVGDKQIETIKFLLSSTKVRVNALNVNGFTALDVLTHSPRDLKDMDIGDSLRGAGAQRASDMPKATRDTRVIRSGNMSLLTQNRVPAQPSRSQGSSWEKYLKRHETWLEKKRSSLMVVASLIATMAFQAGVTPPGGVWQDDGVCQAGVNPPGGVRQAGVNPPVESQKNSGHTAGSSVMAHKHPEIYPKFLGANTTGFVASLSIILLLISGLPLKSRIFMWILMVIMWIAISSMAETYLYSVLTVTPDQVAVEYVTRTSIRVWTGVIGLLLLWNSIRLVIKVLRKFGLLKRRVRGPSSNPVSTV
ncbi:hypothetical protein HHK36_014349 [Tetracentron sinense]|uniref:PGG domain-containing protein n=1 Tax=Tetracentron sinense TaxID=13715 RepID=A0A834ZC35_TETSI|nr:hypothetical protein HHK36_014349 [Tetracentron sinense]